MSQLKFTITENGYSTVEVDRYIGMLQSEYTNAVEWSNEIERRMEEYKAGYTEAESLRKENKKLFEDCKLLASRLRSYSLTQTEAVDNADPSASSEKADEIVENARIRAKEILDSAHRNQEKIISELTANIMDAQAQLADLTKEKETLTAEIKKLADMRQDIAERIAGAQELLKIL